MTDPTPEATPEAAAPATNRRGRPRPEATIARDEQVLQHVNGTVTRAQLAEATGLKESEIYLSLFRLRGAGKVQHAREGGKHVWTRTAEAAPAVA